MHDKILEYSRHKYIIRKSYTSEYQQHLATFIICSFTLFRPMRWLIKPFAIETVTVYKCGKTYPWIARRVIKVRPSLPWYDSLAKMIGDHTRQLYINTGNLINCKELNRRATQSPAEEVAECVKYTLHSVLEKNETNNGAEMLYCINSKNVMKVNKDDRINLKLTVKVFLQSSSCDHLKEAISEIMQQLGVDFLDSVILALPNSSPSSLALENVQPLWLILEQLASEGKVVTIGISDLDTGQLLDLYNWAQVKPSVNQVNLESCCVMPPEMTAFAKENDIQLLTHNDPKELLPQNSLQSILEPFTDKPCAWSAPWILRYSVVVKCRGIIQSKGYLLSAVKEQKPVCNGPC